MAPVAFSIQTLKEGNPEKRYGLFFANDYSEAITQLQTKFSEIIDIYMTILTQEPGFVELTEDVFDKILENS